MVFFVGGLFLYCNQLCKQDQEQFVSLLFIISLSSFSGASRKYVLPSEESTSASSSKLENGFGHHKLQDSNAAAAAAASQQQNAAVAAAPPVVQP